MLKALSRRAGIEEARSISATSRVSGAQGLSRMRELRAAAAVEADRASQGLFRVAGIAGTLRRMRPPPPGGSQELSRVAGIVGGRSIGSAIDGVMEYPAGRELKDAHRRQAADVDLAHGQLPWVGSVLLGAHPLGSSFGLLPAHEVVVGAEPLTVAKLSLAF